MHFNHRRDEGVMEDIARENLQALAANPYPGRGLIVGMEESGNRLIQVYWIMGRSPNSRNRVFESEGSLVRTAPADPAKVSDPSLIIYNAMMELDGVFVATNGDQTDTIIQAIVAGGNFRTALMTRRYEPDGPNWTPRISAICSLRYGVPRAALAILKKAPTSMGCERQFFHYDTLEPGYGRCLTTYRGDGDPLPPFEGEPRVMPLAGGIEAIADSVWDALNADNRVSLAVKAIDLASRTSTIALRNKYQAV